MSAQEWLDRTQAITDAATPGPWETVEDTARRGHITAPVDDPEEGTFVTHCEECMGYVLSAANAEFIAHARTALPQAAAAIRSVLDLHVKVVTDQHVAGPTAVCEPCSEDRMFAVWPCPTIQAIQDTLGDHQ